MALSFLTNRNKGTDAEQEMSFMDHLEALRWHIVRSLIAVLVTAVVLFVNIDWFFDTIILGPIRPDFISYTKLCDFSHWLGAGDALCLPPVTVELQATKFGSQFISSITLAFMGGFIVGFPYVFWEFWRFVKPALTQKELSNTRGSILFVSMFFFMGVAFGYFIMSPFTFSFLSNYTMGDHNTLITRPMLSDYIENLVNITIGAGLAFQLPVLSYALTKIGLITPGFLRDYRKYAYVGLLVIAAVITPSPDWMSQMIVCVPLVVLYEFSIRVSQRVFKKEEEKAWG